MVTGGAALAWAGPVGARAGGAEWTAVEGGPCHDQISVPVAGRFKQLYECVDNTWTVADGVGRAGTPGRDGADGNNGANGTDGVHGGTGPAGQDGHDGRDGIDGATGPRGERGIAGETGPRGETGPAGPGLTMHTGSFTGPAAWDPGGTAPLLPAALEPPAATWAVQFHVVVAAADLAVAAECTVAVGGVPAWSMLAAQTDVAPGTRATLSATGWVTTTGTDLVNVECRDRTGAAAGSIESGTVNLLPVESVSGPPAG